MHKSLFALPLIAFTWSAAAYAGEEPLYDGTPAWVDEVQIGDLLADESAPAELLRDWQYRIEDGVVLAYSDFAIRIDNPAALMAQNTQTLTWLPDKGDLTIHRFEIHREGEVIDLVEQGVTFDVLRRERGLEFRLLDGQLTASVSVPGLREGDVLRIAHTVSTDDQALGDEVQALQFLRSEPWQVGQSRAVVSWPTDEEMFWDAEDRVQLAEPIERGGYNYLSVDLPLEEADPLPYDAPFRYRRPPVLRVGSFESWEELSRIMQPHFESAAVLADNSPIAAEAARIMAQSDDPLERAAMAVRLVQDEVSYLLNGLDGGNYLPQSSEETWEIRYGDCKAKSVLLLSLLREMGIESEVVLVSSSMGDAVPEVLPLPAAFDHMIVHAVIDGTDYWLDGTSAATRLANIGDVPPFYHALPLREGGTGLMPMVQRDLATPQMTMTMTVDHSAGVDMPALFNMSIRMVGAGGAQMQAIADADDPQMLQMMAQSFGGGQGMQVSDLSIEYDADAAVASMDLQGVMPSSFTWEGGRLRVDMGGEQSFSGFNPDRARPEWRQIPVLTQGPARQRNIATMILPENGEGYTLEGELNFEGGFANTRVTRSMSFDNGTVRADNEIFQTLGELPAAELPNAKRAARRLAANTVELVPPEDVTWRWELSEEERESLAAPILAAFEDAIAFADEDDYAPRRARAQFLIRMFDFDAALADYDFFSEEQPSAWTYGSRARLHQQLGNMESAIADRRAAYDLDPSNANARSLANLLAYEGQVDEATELLEFLPVTDDDRPYHDDNLGTVLALGGDIEGGHALIEELVADFPQNATALNGDCWFRGLFTFALDTAIARCTQAVERASNPAAALDSRALIHFRLGQFEEAIADLNSVLDVQPDLAASHYLRGIVRLHAGDAGGAQDIEAGLLMAPDLAATYAHHGIVPPN